MGLVTWLSMTAGAAPSYMVVMETDGVCTSGISRTVSLENATRPNTVSSALSTTATSGRRTEISESHISL